MQLAQRTRSCPGCGRQAVAGASWCGGCGAALAPRPGPMVLRVGAPPAPEIAPPPTRRHRTWVLVLLVVALAGTGLVRDPVSARDPDLLGRLDDATGRSSLLPPADDLQLLWRRTVETVAANDPGPPVLWDLGRAVVVGSQVVAPGDVGGPVAWPAGAVPSPAGDLLLADGDEVVLVDPVDGLVRRRAPLRGAGTWRPVGAAVGWVAGAAVLRDIDGVPGAIDPSGTVRWVGAPTWTWDGIGDGTDWAVVTTHDDVEDRLLVLDGRDGGVRHDVGPASSVHAPTVLGDTLAWADTAAVDAGLGRPVVVHGTRLDGSGSWVVTDLPPTTSSPDMVRLDAVGDAVVVHYPTAGQATTAAWLDPVDGRQVGVVAVLGTGETPGGWPVTAVVGDAIAHVSPTRGEVRVVDRRGVVRWSLPARPGDGLAAAGDVLLLHTPRWVTPIVGTQPRGALHQERLRLFDASTGDLRWERSEGAGPPARFDAVLAGHVGVTADAWPAVVQRQAWFDPDTGRRRTGARLAAAELGEGVADDLAVLGRLGQPGRLVLARPDGRLVATGAPEDPTVDELLAGVGTRGRTTTATVHDARVAVRVAAASVTAVDPGDGRQRWRTVTDVALDPDRTVLLADVVVVAGRDGSVLALDRADGHRRWRLEAPPVTALTAGGEQLVAGTAAGTVLVVDGTGTLVQSVRVGTGAVQDVAVVDQRVLAVLDGEVVGLGRGPFFVEPVDRVTVP